MRRPLLLAALLALAACLGLQREPEPDGGGLVEPDVFDIIRAGNSKAAVDALRDRYEQEVTHARLLEARIGELIAAEEGLSLEHHDRLVALQSIKDQVRKLADEQAALGQALDDAARGKADSDAQLVTLRAENAATEKAIAEELARREELKKQLEAAQSGKTGKSGKDGPSGKPGGNE